MIATGTLFGESRCYQVFGLQPIFPFLFTMKGELGQAISSPGTEGKRPTTPEYH
jgi:hypothetical protein